jgi:hypothetical protein
MFYSWQFYYKYITALSDFLYHVIALFHAGVMLLYYNVNIGMVSMIK